MTARLLAAAAACWVLTLATGSPPPSPSGVAHVSPDALRWLTLDRPHTAATLLWARNTLVWIGTSPASSDVESTVLIVAELDPDWRAPMRYGALMLGSLGDVAAYERVLGLQVERHPADLWFPRALAMSRLLHSNDAAGAAHWLRWAAAQPDAPDHLAALAESLERAP